MPGLPTLILNAGTGGLLIGSDVGAMVGSWKICDPADSPKPAEELEPPGLGMKTAGLFTGLFCWFTGLYVGDGLGAGSMLANDDSVPGLATPIWEKGLVTTGAGVPSPK